MIGILKGLQIVIKHAFRKPVTLQYPDEKRHDLSPRFRGELKLRGLIGDNGQAGKDRWTETPNMPPCMSTCPANMKIREYVGLISEGKYIEAVAKMKEDNPLPLICGRVCPHPCEEACRRGEQDQPVSINALKRFAADVDLKLQQGGKVKPPTPGQSKGKKVAVVGAGPAGLTCAYYLALKGYQVTIFDRFPVAGGMLAVGIPDYRLPRNILQAEVDQILTLGVELKLNTTIENLNNLFSDGFEAVFLGVGAHRPVRLGIEGEDLKGVLPGETFLADVALGRPTKMGKKVAVIGGGNTAVDCARVSLREGAKEVHILYRRTKAEMPAHEVEIDDALEEGINIQYLVAPTKVIGKNGRVSGISCQRMELGEKDRTGRRRPVPVEGSDFLLDVDTIMSAISRTPELEWLEGTGVEIHPKWGTIVTDEETGETSRPGVFAGGDVSLGANIAIAAIGMGKRAAISMDAYLSGQDLKEAHRRGMVRAMVKPMFLDVARQVGAKLEGKDRIKGYDEVELGLTQTQALAEAKRCLSCESQVCIGCQICEENCPTRAITISPRQDNRQRVIDDWTVDDGICIYCGICVEMCPTKTLYHSAKYELAEDRVAKLVKHKNYLLRPDEMIQEEGWIKPHKLVSGEEILYASGRPKPDGRSQMPDGSKGTQKTEDEGRKAEVGN